jgi:hypothetical protein
MQGRGGPSWEAVHPRGGRGTAPIAADANALQTHAQLLQRHFGRNRLSQKPARSSATARLVPARRTPIARVAAAAQREGVPQLAQWAGTEQLGPSLAAGGPASRGQNQPSSSEALWILLATQSRQKGP